MARDLNHVLEVCLDRTARLCGLDVPSGCDRDLLFREVRANEVTFVQFLQHVSDELGLDVAALVRGLAVCESFDALRDQVEELAAVRRQGSGEAPLCAYSVLTPRGPQEETAIVGVACRLPGDAGDAETFWTVLSEGKDGIVPIPIERWDSSQLSDAENERGAIYVKEGGFIGGIEEFDNRFFQISASEAKRMDPQQRILLELSYEAFLSAGRDPLVEDLRSFGTFVGCSCADWTILRTKHVGRFGAFTTVNTPQALLANRISYTFNASGPSLTVDSASSSALVAACVAASYLEMGRCRSCIVASSSVMLVPEPTIALCAAGMLASDSRCRPFDAAANGYGRAEGAVVFVLERTVRATSGEGPRRFALIRGYGTNHNGHTVSVTAPYEVAQRTLIGDALQSAQLSPADVTYFEAHGTGTTLGDTIEFKAIKAVFASSRGTGDPLLVGSVKSNIGHLEGCAGAAGLLKAVLILWHRIVPPTLHFRRINPLIDDQDFNYSIPTSCTAIGAGHDKAVYVSISSLGLGGSNAHIILEEPEQQNKATASALRSQYTWQRTIFSVFEDHEPDVFEGLALQHCFGISGSKNPESSRRHSTAGVVQGSQLVAAHLRRFSASSLNTHDRPFMETDRVEKIEDRHEPRLSLLGRDGVTEDEVKDEALECAALEETADSMARMGGPHSSRTSPAGHNEQMLFEELKTIVIASLHQVMKESIDIPLDHPLKELGLTSLGAVEFRDCLQDYIELTLPSTLIFDYPTVIDICRFLSVELGNRERAAGPNLAAQELQELPSPRALVGVVGIACRFPGASRGMSELWQMLMGQKDCVQEIPGTRFSIDALFDHDVDAQGKVYVREAGFVPNLDCFDPSFFRISEAEVSHLDPHQRVLLEVAYESFEDAQLTLKHTSGGTSIGVVVGCSGNDWNTFLQRHPLPPTSFSGPGASPALLSNRLSYNLGLTGPSLTVDTACSSSLVAMDIARRLLTASECRLAAVGGVQLLLTSDSFVNYCRARMLSPDCRCKTFDAAANGYVRSEGCGVVVLEKLTEKSETGERVYGWVLGTAANHGGKVASVTAPNGPAQQSVIRAALRTAPAEATQKISLVETHGTGTALGDPIELGALRAVYGRSGTNTTPLVLGALKTRIGHTEGAAGIAGFIKLIC
ncbi:type i fatty acid, partial [Cystoisospora suis]